MIASYGFNRTTIYKWINAARQHGVGFKALRSRGTRARSNVDTKARTAGFRLGQQS